MQLADLSDGLNAELERLCALVEPLSGFNNSEDPGQALAIFAQHYLKKHQDTASDDKDEEDENEIMSEIVECIRDIGTEMHDAPNPLEKDN